MEDFKQYEQELQQKLAESFEVIPEPDVPQLLVEERAVLDTWSNSINKDIGIPDALYYYAFGSDDIINEALPEQVPGPYIPPVSAVKTVMVNPYLHPTNDLTRITVDYDTRRFPLDEVKDPNPLKAYVKPQKRITYQKNIYKDLITFNPYGFISKPTMGVGQPRDWRRESKLYNAPFTTGFFDDGLMPIMEFLPHLAYDAGSTVKLRVRSPLTPQGTYQLYIQGYNGDADGYYYGAKNASSPQLPSVSSAYTDYMTANQNQNKVAIDNATWQNRWGAIGLGVGAVAAIATAGPTAGLSVASFAGGAAMTAQGMVGNHHNIKAIMAAQEDVSNVPHSVSSFGTDGVFDLVSHLKTGKHQLVYGIKQCRPEKMQQLGDYFALYGYAQNKFMKPRLRDRYYYTFIKCGEVNITCDDGYGIPKAHFEKLKSIYMNGTTVWAIDRPGVHVGDYSMDNVEV